MGRKFFLVFFILVTIISGCALRREAPKPRAVMTSTPEVQAVSNVDYDIHLKPLKNGHTNFVAFELTVQNRSNQPIYVDWNTTRYLYQGRSTGRVLWRGIDRRAFISERVELEKIAPGQIFSKEIAPHRIVSWDPLSNNQTVSKEGNLVPAHLPAGENGLRFFVRHNGHLLRETLTVFLAQKNGT